MPDSTGEQRTAKNAAYKQLLIDQFSIRVNPLETDWAAGLMEQFMDNNDDSGVQAAAANNYIVVTLGQSYPVIFQLT